ncbi:unnamed protein product (macronuclear) [Paramecium tetraurelia]|uniref:Protein kinase domain-containing protein n=1 Tax=Paramecium tetraurelia TaxID=5888 RepID=A0CA62_PARTE|nr:uncharacterized protein GSPATT00036459001 [Paramecium tetraurelia]CAK67679.1 unnamed protein product [Paramecium tetraurelia]|eukprot:XP_001435076.1 hypothetical protein (macronuclear) [Paramecium tetraurelia strain d4-2]
MGICSSQSNSNQKNPRQKQQLKIILPNKSIDEPKPEIQVQNQSNREASAQNTPAIQNSQQSIHSPVNVVEDKRKSVLSHGLSKQAEKPLKQNSSRNIRSGSLRSLNIPGSPSSSQRGSLQPGVQFFSTNASKKYSFLHNKECQRNPELSFIQGNKNGKKARLEVLSKEEQDSIKYIYWLKSNQLDHKHILKNLEVHQDNNAYQLVLEDYDGWKLSRLQNSEDLTEIVLANIADQMFQVLSYFKNLSINHGNLTMNSWEYHFISGQVFIKLVDIKSISTKKVEDIDVICYMPPEQLYKEEFKPERDLWAVMLILYTLGKGSLPYQIPPQQLHDAPSVKQLMLHTTFDVEADIKKFSKDFISILQSVVAEKYPKKRKTLEELKANKWIVDLKYQEIPLQERLLTNMLNQKDSCLLQQAILEIMIQEFEQETALQLQKIFSEFDGDMDTIISKEELIKMFQKYTKLKDLESQIDKIFVSHSLKEEQMAQFTFLSLAAPRDQLLTQTNLETVFNLLSNNKSEIHANNVTKYLNVINEELEAQFDELAPEKKLTLDQFIRMMELLR